MGPVLFLITVNDLPDGIRSYLSIFADDTKIMEVIGDVKHCKTLLGDVDGLAPCQDGEVRPKDVSCAENGEGIERPRWNCRLDGESLYKSNCDSLRILYSIKQHHMPHTLGRYLETFIHYWQT